MASDEEFKSPQKDAKKEEAISLQSNPPDDEAPEYSQKSTPPPQDEFASPDKSPEEEISGEKRPDTLKDGDMIGNYRIEKMIGRGGMATVYRGFDVANQRIVAVKVLKERFSSSMKALARFGREFLALETLNHPNIVRVLDKGVDEGVNYFVMEYVNGASLSRLLRHRQLAFNTRAQILLHVASALDYAHRRGIVHRDIKPDNVLIDRTGRAKLADFGIAQITAAHMPLTSITVVSSFMGTADYMAPEQRTDAKSVDYRADIYSFGVMMYEVFTGKLPLGNFPLPSQLNLEVGKRMDNIILKALMQDPAARYQSVLDMAEDIKREISATGLSMLKARMALIFQNEGFRKIFGIRTIGAISMLAVVAYAVVWLLSAFGGPYPPGNERRPGAATPPVTITPMEPETGQVSNVLKDMVHVPAGLFKMGADWEFDNESPMREVYLDAFYIDKHEVTNAEYKKFVDEKGHRVPFVDEFWAQPFNWRHGTYPPGKQDYPVVLVSWEDAKAYAKWAGKRLPTEAEWEKAARGDDGRVYPWGDEWDINKCNIRESFLDSTRAVYEFSEGKSPYGCYNMAGNVMEWVADRYSERYYRHSPNKNPPGPIRGKERVVRGGAWDTNISLYARTAYRHNLPPEKRSASVGFRCAKDAEKE